MPFITLIEVVVYLGLMTLLLGALFEAFAMDAGMAGRMRARASIEIEGDFLEDKLAYFIEHAWSVRVPAPSILILEDREKRVGRVFADNGVLLLTRPDGTLLPLTASGTMLEALAFEAVGHGRVGTESERVSVAFTISMPDSTGALIRQRFSRIVYLPPYAP